ncbi:MAG: iron-sulfur cluster assembly scaffold protein [bacterium]|nr:iron-sulfur cluster assembly scaffold protein [bacterium]
MDEELYKEHILEHYRNPHNKRELPYANIQGSASNPICGDDVAIYINLSGEHRLIEVSFLGEGCVVSQAAGSMLTDKLRGMELRDVKLLSPGDIYSMLAVRISPARVNCALLSYEALSNGLKKLDSNQ